MASPRFAPSPKVPPLPAWLADTSFEAWAEPGDDSFDALWRKKEAIQDWARQYGLNGWEYPSMRTIDKPKETE
jgi:hypothetical protein